MSSAVEQLLGSIQAGGWPLLVRWCDDHHPENLHLDFKTKRNAKTPTLDSEDRQNFSIALSGFANADGGLIIWGIQTKRRDGSYDSAEELKPIRNPSGFVNALTELAPEMVSPFVNSMAHQTYKDPSDPSAGIVVTSVLASDSAPHMATGPKLHRYYRRAGPSFRPLEHYEVADLFGRRPHARLQLGWWHKVSLSKHDPGVRGSARFYLHLSLINNGRGVARRPAITLGKPDGWTPEQRSPSSSVLAGAKAPRGWPIRLIGGSDFLLYPDDEVEVARYVFAIESSMATLPELRIPFRLVAPDLDTVEGNVEIASKDIVAAAEKCFATKNIPFAAAPATPYGPAVTE